MAKSTASRLKHGTFVGASPIKATIMNTSIRSVIDEQVEKATVAHVKNEIRKKITKLIRDDKRGVVTAQTILLMLENGQL